MSSAFDRALSVALTLSAVAIAATLLARSLSSVGAGAEAIVPVRIESVAQAESVGVRIGAATAPVQIIAISDLQCPVCARVAPAIDSVLAEFGDSVSVVHLLVALPYHAHATQAALAAECAENVGRFHDWTREVYASQHDLGVRSWGSFALAAGIQDTAAIAACAAPRGTSLRLRGATAFAEQVGYTGTPTLIVNGMMLPLTPSEVQLRTMVAWILEEKNPFSRRGWRRLTSRQN